MIKTNERNLGQDMQTLNELTLDQLQDEEFMKKYKYYV